MASTGHYPNGICHSVASAKVPHFELVRRIRHSEAVVVGLRRVEVVGVWHQEGIVVDVQVGSVVEYVWVGGRCCGVEVILVWLAVCLRR